MNGKQTINVSLCFDHSAKCATIFYGLVNPTSFDHVIPPFCLAVGEDSPNLISTNANLIAIFRDVLFQFGGE